MKTATYRGLDGKDIKILYDEGAPCIVCGEPVVAASVGGTAICPWCDMGICRFCRIQLPWGMDKEQTTRKIREHINWHKEIKDAI